MESQPPVRWPFTVRTNLPSVCLSFSRKHIDINFLYYSETLWSIRTCFVGQACEYTQGILLFFFLSMKFHTIRHSPLKEHWFYWYWDSGDVEIFLQSLSCRINHHGNPSYRQALRIFSAVDLENPHIMCDRGHKAKSQSAVDCEWRRLLCCWSSPLRVRKWFIPLLSFKP